MVEPNKDDCVLSNTDDEEFKNIHPDKTGLTFADERKLSEDHRFYYQSR